MATHNMATHSNTAPHRSPSEPPAMPGASAKNPSSGPQDDTARQDRLSAIIHSIARAPESWRSWSCLALRPAPGASADRGEEMLCASASLLSSYLSDFEHHLFLHAGRELYAFCRAVPLSVLGEAREQISAIAAIETGEEAQDATYDLETQSKALEAHFHNNGGDVLSFHGPASSRHRAQPLFSDFGSGRPGSPALDRNPETSAVRVLLVDDDPVTRWMVRNALRHECRFVTASNARSACAMIQSYRPDVVFLDIDLPDRDGRSVLEWIVTADPGACVVMFSSNGDLDNVAGTLESGARGFIAKPFLRESLLHYVRRETRET